MEAECKELIALTAVSMSALVINRFYWTCSMFGLYTYGLLTPPMLFIDDLRTPLEKIWVYVSLTVVIFGLALSSALQFLFNGKCLGIEAWYWLDITYTAGMLYCLPLYFTFVRPPGPAPEAQEALNGPLVVTLPGGIVVGIAFLPGFLMDTVVRSNECRAAVKALSCYIALVCCTLGVAAVAAWLNLVAAEIFLAYLGVLSIVSLVYCGRRFIWPHLNTRRSSRILYFVAFPAAVAATYGLHATGIVELQTIDDKAILATVFLTLAFNFVAPPPYIRTMFLLVRRRHH